MKMGRAALLTLFLLLYVCSSTLQAHSETLVYVKGVVLDATTGQPIKNAVVVLGNVPTKPSEWRQLENRTSDDNGCFAFRVRAENSYSVLAFHDEPETQGFDYAPLFRSVVANDNLTLQFNLHPAMSIVFSGDLLFVEATRPSDYYSYTILANGSGEEYVQSYGTSPPCYDFLDLPANCVIVPVDREFALNLSARVMAERGEAFRSFIIDIGEHDSVRGDLIKIDIQRYSVRFNLNLTVKRLTSSAQRLTEIEGKGFYVADEKQDLARAESLLELAEAKLGSGRYDEGYADIRESHLNIAETDRRFGELYSNALSSVLILVVFISLTAVALAYFLFDHRRLRYIASTIFFATLFTALYLVYPGCRLTSTTSLSWNVLISLGVSACAVLVLPFILGGEVISIFSLAKLNLRKRKLRFTLTLTSVMMLVLSFVSLTSFATGYGLITKTFWTLTPNPSGLLLKRPLPSESNKLVGFIPIDPSTISAVQDKPEVLTVAPMMENTPTTRNIGYLSSSTKLKNTLPISGILGILPSAETNTIRIDRMIAQGRYLDDDDENSILISKRAASLLEIGLNDKLVLSTATSRVNVIVVGFLDDAKLGVARDVDGEDLLPRKFVTDSETGTYFLTACSPEEVVVAPLKLASKMSAMFISRMHIVLKDWGSALSFSRKIALERGLAAYYSSGNEAHQVLVGSYLEAKGLSIFVPWIIVILSVIATVLNAVYEQKREIAILSSIGLNPSHIMGLFVAEASIIGLVGGSIGYLFGLGSYRLMSAMSIVPEVQAKVSAAWCLAAILVSMAAVIVGAAVALRSSVVVTPSLIRRWYLEDKTRETDPGLGSASQMPVRVREEDLDSMFDHVIKSFKESLLRQGVDLDRGTIRRSVENIGGRDVVRVRFNYILGQQFKRAGGYPFELVAEREEEKTYGLEVICRGDEETVRGTTTFIRLALIEWSSLNR